MTPLRVEGVASVASSAVNNCIPPVRSAIVTSIETPHTMMIAAQGIALSADRSSAGARGDHHRGGGEGGEADRRTEADDRGDPAGDDHDRDPLHAVDGRRRRGGDRRTGRSSGTRRTSTA